MRSLRRSFGIPADLPSLGGDAHFGEVAFAGKPWFDVTHPNYGATGDGTTNDQPAIQAAIDAAEAAGGGVVFFPAGTYKIADGGQLLVDSNDVTLRGSGIGVTIIDGSAETGSTALIRITASYCRVESMTILGCRGTGTGVALSTGGGGTDFSAARLRIVDAGAQAFTTNKERVVLEDLIIETPNTSAVYCASGSSDVLIARLTAIQPNRAMTPGHSAVTIQGNTTAGQRDENFEIVDLHCSGALGNGIWVATGGVAAGQPLTRNVKIRGGWIVDMEGDNTGGTEGEAISATCDDLQVSDMYFRNVTREAVNWTVGGVNNYTLRGFKATGLIIIDATAKATGINVGNGSAIDIVATGSGICQDFVIDDIVVIDTRGTAQTRAGVSLHQNASGAIVRRGKVSGVRCQNMSLGKAVEITTSGGASIAEAVDLLANYPGDLAAGNDQYRFNQPLRARFFQALELNSTVTGTQNDFALTEIGYLTWNGGSAVTFGGFTNGQSGRRLIIRNRSSTQLLTLAHNAAGSTSANRFSSPTGADVVVPPQASCTLIYDSLSSRWVIVSHERDVSKGTATVANASTSIAVNHGLGQTPALTDIQVTPTNDMGLASHFWISTPTSTQFTIHVDIDPGASTATFVWQAQIL